jgi:hypothetical protein
MQDAAEWGYLSKIGRKWRIQVPPDFLRTLASANFMWLSSMKAAHVPSRGAA